MWHVFLALLLGWWAASPAASQDVKQVAIIGGGIGGAASSFWLKSLLPHRVNVTIFERHEALGGRTSSWEHEGSVYELGASIAWTGNHYMRFLAGEVGLELREDLGDDGGLLAIFDGSQLVFKESQWTLLTLIRLLWRYGLAFFQLRSKPMEMFRRFDSLYSLQGSGVAFERPEAFLKKLGLYGLTQDSLFQYIREQFGAGDASMDLFASEVVAGVGRVNYNQGNSQLNALAGLVSLLPAAEPSVFAIKGGNQQLAQRLAAKAGANILTGAAVAEVVALEEGGFLVVPAAGGSQCQGADPPGPWGGGEGPGTAAPQEQREEQAGLPLPVSRGVGAEAGQVPAGGTAATARRRSLLAEERSGRPLGSGGSGGGGGGSGGGGRERACSQGAGASATPLLPNQTFDAVILAAPLEHSGIAIRGIDGLPRVLAKRQYQVTVTTLVQGELQPGYFGLPEEGGMPFTTIMVTEAAQVPFSSLSRVGGARGAGAGPGVFKLFSSAPLPDAQLALIFRPGYRLLVARGWHAYPRFDPPEDFAPFQLAPGLLYSSALENAASAMEIAAIAARNSALLAARHLAPAGQQAAAA